MLKERDALEVAKTWKVKARTLWTDSSCLESGKVGAVVAWWEVAHTPPECVGRTRRRYHRVSVSAGWTGRGFHLGTNKEVFGVEVHAIHQALKTLTERNESHAAQQHYPRKASRAHLTRKTTERRPQATRDWISNHARAERRY